MTTEKTLEELLVEAEEFNDPSGLSEGRMLHSGNDEVPMPMGVSSLESGGYVYVYHTETGDRSRINSNMLAMQLTKTLDNGARAFTTEKPSFEPESGTIKCLLHPDDPNRGHYDSLGFATCPKENIPSPYQLQLHMAGRHRLENATIQEEAERVEKEEEREFQRMLLQAAASGIANPPSSEYFDCECGTAGIKKVYQRHHNRTKKHLKWERKNA
tara:strand:+ start:124 stop:765 length:642 start_codon:yes stop_codon:yes gene_type:complete